MLTWAYIKRCIVWYSCQNLRHLVTDITTSMWSAVHTLQYTASRNCTWHYNNLHVCLDGKRKNCQVCFVFWPVLCATIVHSELHTHMNRRNNSLDCVLSHWAHFTVLRFIFVYVLFCVWLYIACMYSIVTWWGGPRGIEAWYLGPLLPSVLWHCWLGHLTCKTHPRYDL